MKLIRLATTMGIVVALMLSINAGAVASAAPGPQTSPTNWTVLVGGEGLPTNTEHGPVGSWSFMRFYPGNITINVGDTITFKQKSTEIHNVLFVPAGKQYPDFIIPEGGGSQRLLLNPLVAYPQGGNDFDGTAYTGSGVFGLGGPQAPTEWKVSFSKPGTFTFVCSIHSSVSPQTGQPVGMVGQVTVQAAGTAYPKTQSQLDQEAQVQLAADIKSAQAVDGEARKITTRPGPNGTTIYTMNMGFTTPDMVGDLMRFGQHDLTIKAGDTVEWVQKSMDAPHTVSFFSGAKEPDFALPEPQPNGPPRLVLNVQALIPAGGKVYSGKDVFNSGRINGTMVSSPEPRTYSLTFDTPGKFDYICIFHDQEGMDGTITVQGAGQKNDPGLPDTGAGFQSDSNYTMAWVLLLVIGVLAIGSLIFVKFKSKQR